MQRDHRCVLLCTATNENLVTFLFTTATNTNHISKCLDFLKTFIDTITTSNFYLEYKENNENATWLHKFLGLFFIPADSQAKLAQQLVLTMLPFHPLYFSQQASTCGQKHDFVCIMKGCTVHKYSFKSPQNVFRSFAIVRNHAYFCALYICV